MKHNHNHDNAPNPGPQLMPVHFEFAHPTARSVCIAGTFNGWHPTTKSMHDMGNGHWLKEAFLAPGDYEYCLIVDGQWRPDPGAPKTVPNPYGGVNSLLQVAPAPASTPRAAVQILPLKKPNKKNAKKL